MVYIHYLVVIMAVTLFLFIIIICHQKIARLRFIQSHSFLGVEC